LFHASVSGAVQRCCTVHPIPYRAASVRSLMQMLLYYIHDYVGVRLL